MIVSARLSEDEIASLNIFMAKHGFTTVGDLIRAVISGSVQIRSLTVVDRLDRVTNKLLTIVDNLRMNEGASVENTDLFIKNQCGRWDSNPRTPERLEPQSSAFGHAGRLPR